MSDSLSSFEYPAKAIFFIFAMTIIGYISYMAFDGPPTERGDGPILRAIWRSRANIAPLPLSML